MSLIKKNGNGLSVPTIFSDFFDTDKFFNDAFFKRDLIPAVNVSDTENTYEIELAAPGLKKSDFKVNVENGVLTISAETQSEEEETNKNYTRREFRSESFSRAFSLPENANEEKIGAKYEDGVLKLSLAKKVPAAVAKKKEIAVA